MYTDRHDDRHSHARWDVILGVLFVMSFLGVTLALAIGDASEAAPDGSDSAVTTMLDHDLLK